MQSKRLVHQISRQTRRTDRDELIITYVEHVQQSNNVFRSIILVSGILPLLRIAVVEACKK